MKRFGHRLCFTFLLFIVEMGSIFGLNRGDRTDYLEFNIGPNFSVLSDLKTDHLFNYELGLTTGIFYRRLFESSFGFKTGFQYSLSRSSYDVKDIMFIDSKINSFGLNFQGTYSLGFYPFVDKRYVKKMEVCFGLGLGIDYVSYVNDKRILVENFDKELLDKNFFVNDSDMYPIMVGLSLSVTAIYRITDIHNIFMTVDYYHSLNILNSTGSHALFLNRTFISIGYSLPFKVIFN